MNCSAYRHTASEQARVADLMRLVPPGLGTALDVGARDGFLSARLADRIASVTALDLATPEVPDPRVTCVAGDATRLQFADASFDLVLCSEVLEHIPTPGLEQACRELVRVSRRHLLIGVPYRQDIRDGRTTCQGCGAVNPPYGHVNTFDEHRLARLFEGCTPRTQTFVGEATMGTNWLAARLMDAAGNPYGSYDQDESCIHCSRPIGTPGAMTLPQRVAARLAEWTRRAQVPFFTPHGNWLHVLFERTPPAEGCGAC